MSNMIESRSHKLIILIVDLCLIFLAYYLAFHIRFDSIPERNWNSFLELSPWILLISLLFLSAYELYSLKRKTAWDIIGALIISVTLMTFLTMSASYLFREFAFPRTVIVIAYFFMIIFLCLWKIVFMKLSNKYDTGRVLLIGDENEASKIIDQIKSPLLKGTKITHIHTNTSLERIYELIQQTDHVMLCPGLDKEKKSAIIYQAIKGGKTVYIVPSLYDLLVQKSIMTAVDDTMVMAVKPFGLSWDQQILKRIFDVVISLVLLILLLPLFVLTAILIKIEDPKGRIIFKQKRIGKYNREFKIYKFRSMIEEAEYFTGPVLATENDSRITKVGKFIRLTRIDELPQLVNVLIGGMSLVGPRPERKFFTKKFLKQDDSYQYRNTVHPGITGYAQIMGKYTTDVEDKLRYDLYYIRNYSFGLDLVILFRTLIILFKKSKAEGKPTKAKNESKKNVSPITTKDFL